RDFDTCVRWPHRRRIGRGFAHLYHHRQARLARRQTLALPRVVKESSGSGVELKQAAESVVTANGPALWTQRYVWRREEEKVALTLVIPLKMMMFDVFVQRPA